MNQIKNLQQIIETIFFARLTINTIVVQTAVDALKTYGSFVVSWTQTESSKILGEFSSYHKVFCKPCNSLM